MKQVVTPDYIGLRVGQEGESVSAPGAKTSRDLWSIHADSNRTHSQTLKRIEIVLDTPQLGVTERSPITAIENQKDGLRMLDPGMLALDGCRCLSLREQFG